VIDIPKLITELKLAGDGWNRHVGSDQIGHMRDLCRRAAMALEEQQAAPTKAVTQTGWATC
jgi:hypothetical protein